MIQRVAAATDDPFRVLGGLDSLDTPDITPLAVIESPLARDATSNAAITQNRLNRGEGINVYKGEGASRGEREELDPLRPARAGGGIARLPFGFLAV